MSIWDIHDNPEDELCEKRNPYLVDSAKGIKLISKLLPSYHKNDLKGRTAEHLEFMLDKAIMRTLHEVKVDDALGLSKKLKKISDQIFEYRKIRLLMGKTIVGIGGQFSAGKSCFINSLLQSNKMSTELLLPEDQNPTTSIPTYIVNGVKQEILAYTRNHSVYLNFEAMQAMTHEFYKVYNIGFSRFVSIL